MYRRVGEQLEFWFPDREGHCENCKEFTGLKWSPTGSIAKDVNPGFWACEECDREHREYWDEMWLNYYSERTM